MMHACKAAGPQPNRLFCPCCIPLLSQQDGTGKDPVMNFFGIKDEDAPVLVGFEMAKNKKFRLREDLK